MGDDGRFFGRRMGAALVLCALALLLYGVVQGVLWLLAMVCGGG